MPLGLRFTTLFCAIFSIFAPISLLPFGEHRINDVSVDFVEFWRQGGGPAFLLFGGICVSITYGFLQARPWSRLLFFLAMLVLTCCAVITPQFESIVIAIVLNGWAFWYFFRCQTVTAYFFEANKHAV